MSYQLSWMPDVLLKAELKVAECEGWRERGRGDMGKVRGVMCHHTANPQPGNMPTLEVLKRGRLGLQGPLCNLALGRDGTFYVVAAGRANHAGPGRWENITTGNSSFIGIEAENDGKEEEWPKVQMDAYRRGVAALLARIGAGANMCVGHGEYATPRGRKVDPSFEMLPFRNLVSDFLQGKSAAAPIKAVDATGRPTLRRAGDNEPGAVAELQKLIGVRHDGIFGPRTEAALREWQRGARLVPDGICGPKTWEKLLRSQGGVQDGVAQMPQQDGSDQLEISEAGIALIKSFESCERRTSDGKFKAYPDPGSSNQEPWTIGWGSIGADIKDGTVWTKEECDQRFNSDIKRYVWDVIKALEGAETTQNQFDALVSFHYNTGAIRKATLTKLHREGKRDLAAREFGKWIRNDGRIMRGLVRRRDAEAELYRTPDAGEAAGSQAA